MSGIPLGNCCMPLKQKWFAISHFSISVTLLSRTVSVLNQLHTCISSANASCLLNVQVYCGIEHFSGGGGPHKVIYKFFLG